MLTRCEACNGLIPHAAEACPNCLSHAPSTSTVKRVGLGALAVVAGAGVSLTLMACYGAPMAMVTVPPDSPTTTTSASSAPVATDPAPGTSAAPAATDTK